MTQGFISIPFKAEKHSGLSEVNGIAKFSGAGVVLEFESKLFGLISDGVKEVRVPLSEMMDITFRKGFLKRSAKIEIRLNSMAALAGLPNDSGKVTLKIARADLDRGREAVEQLQKTLSTYRSELPPPHSPVSELFADESEDETRQLK